MKTARGLGLLRGFGDFLRGSASEPGTPWYWARRQTTAVHRPSKQRTVSAATRKTSSVIAAGLSPDRRTTLRRVPKLSHFGKAMSVRWGTKVTNFWVFRRPRTIKVDE